MNGYHFVRLAAFTAAVALELASATTGAQAAQNKVYIDLGGSPAPMKGETTTTKAGWVEISSFSWGMTKGSTPGSASDLTTKKEVSIGSQSAGAGAGKVSLSALNVTLNNQADELKLMTAALDGKTIPTVELAAYKVTPKGLVPVYNVTFKDVTVTSIDWTGKNDKPSANVSLGYKDVEIDENKQASKTDDPAVPAGWNRVENKVDLTTTPIS